MAGHLAWLAVLFFMDWNVKNLFNCKGDNFKLKQILPSFVVSVGTNLRI